MKGFLRYLFTFLFIFSVSGTFSCKSSVTGKNIVFPDADKVVAKKILTLLHIERQKAEAEGRTLSTSELMLLASYQLMGIPYVTSSLDTDWEGEQLRISLTGTDCILFVETCLNLAVTAASSADPSDTTFNAFVMNMASTRYRIPGPEYSYSDRIHYTTEWIRRQEGQTLKDMTLELGGKTIDHPVSYMTAHPGSYPLLSDKSLNPSADKDLAAIRKVEDQINQTPMTVILKENMPAALKDIRSGDIICYVTSVEGLDISHVAIALVKDGRVGFIHASSKEMKVVTDAKTIFEYVSASHNLMGIKVVRPL